MVPLQGCLAGAMGDARRDMSRWSDTRVEQLAEVLNGTEDEPTLDYAARFLAGVARSAHTITSRARTLVQ